MGREGWSQVAAVQIAWEVVAGHAWCPPLGAVREWSFSSTSKTKYMVTGRLAEDGARTLKMRMECDSFFIWGHL